MYAENNKPWGERKERRMKKGVMMLAVLSLFSIWGAGLCSTESSTFARYPAISPDGKAIAFSFQGDIWIAGIKGDNPRRLTIHQAYEKAPVWSPDGSRIAFSGNRLGTDDVFTIPSRGGASKRLTWHSANDLAADWDKSLGIIFTTSRTFRQIERVPEIYCIGEKGGTPRRLLDELGSEPAVSPNGKFVAFVRGECREEREQYRGPANRNIWIYAVGENKYIPVTVSEAQDIRPRWKDDNTLFFLSAENGTYNICSVPVQDDGTPGHITSITAFTEDGIRYFDVNGPGNCVVFERKTGLFHAQADGKNVRKISLTIGADYRFDPVEHKVFTNDITGYSVSPGGDYSSVTVHGEVFVTENHKSKKRTVNISSSPWRDRDAQWMDDTTVVFLSDRNGQYDIYCAYSADTNEPDLFRTLERARKRLTKTSDDESSLSVSPDGSKLAYVRGGGTLVVADISPEHTLANETVLLDGWAQPQSITWSPDSKWLAYAVDDLNFNTEVFIHAADNSKKPVNVSMHPRADYSPVWSPDGSKLAFCSVRNNMDSDVWFVWLRKIDWEKTAEDWEDEESVSNGKDTDKDKKDKKPEPVVIDLKDIHERAVQVTQMPGNETNVVISKDGKTFYFTGAGPSGKGTDLFSVSWNKKDLKQVTKGGQSPYGLSLDKKGNYLYMLKKGRLSRLKIKGEKQEPVAFSAAMDIDYVAELEQIFEETWRTLYTGFYDPDFHGDDFVALKKKYKVWALQASTKHDFRDMVNRMLGQLNASHMGLYGQDRAKTQNQRTGYLGIDLLPESKGVRVQRVIPESPADKIASKLRAGDRIMNVDGVQVNKNVNFYSLLANTRGRKVLLEVEDTQGKTREVVIQPAGSIRNNLYNEWVGQRRELTDKFSGGRLGYLHIQGMDMNSFERFEREFTAAASGKEGIVIDVRYNGGGWTTDYLMAVLNVKQHAYTIPRGAAKNLKKDHKKFRDYYPYAARLPFHPWMKPSIALCNESSYSNAEIFSHAYKTLGIGTLVGKPTFGAVISTGGAGLIDGSFVRKPFRAWYVRATDENMELGPAVPHITVDNPPGSKAAGKDPQLQAAVKELLRQIDE